MVKLKLTKRSRHVWGTEHNGQYIDFYKLPSDGLWRSSYTDEQISPEHREYRRSCGSMKVCKMIVERLLTQQSNQSQGAA